KDEITVYGKTMLEAVIYTRLSKMAGARSTQEQEQECRAWCDRNGYPVRKVFTDNISASRFASKDRPEWERCKQALRKGDILVVWEPSRAGRDLEGFVELRNLCASLEVPLSYGGKVHDLTLGDDRFVAGLDALLSERESEQISLRVLRSKRAAAAEGRPAGKPPWGYRRKVDPDTGIHVIGAWEFDPVEAPRVREAVRRFLDGQSMTSIMKWLRDTDGWTPSSITALQRGLTRPSIAGIRTHQGERVSAGNWEPLITEEQYNQLVRRVESMKRAYGYVSSPGPEPKYLLSGIAECGVCGAKLERKTFRKRSPAYVCPNAHVCRSAEPLEKRVEDELFELVSKVDPAKHDDGDPGVQQALDEIADIERELDDWMESAGKREISRQAFVKIEKRLRARIAELRPKTMGAPGLARVDYSKVQQRWGSASMAQKREAIRRLSIKVYSHRAAQSPSTCPNHPGEKTYARGLCRNCYQQAWRGLAPMPPKLEPSPGLVVIELI
ncbi:recombinase family protein, partial [Mycolicibacterium septicum]|uniref:recombinase family protein n=1 Tax=Mycolicibacterium septicum TaxID=98668 RepID=UPI001AF26BF9